MERTAVLAHLQHYIGEQVLDGKLSDLDETTPLLEWGVINSIEIVRLLSFISRQFAVDVPPKQMIADNFVNLGAITDLVMCYLPEPSTPTLDGVR